MWYRVIPSGEIFNACDPAHLWDISRQYPDWLDSKYDGLRTLLRDTFVTEFDALTGHYTRLRESISKKGIQIPIVVTERPRRFPVGLSCEYLGGSRLMIAQALGIDIPCVVEGESGEVLTIDEIRDLFPGHTVSQDMRITPQKWSHMPGSYTMEEQRRCRKQAKQKQIEAWQRWKKQNTPKCGALTSTR